MNCQDIQKFAFTYLDGEFADHERGEFEEHLRRCMACRTVVDRDALLRDMVARHLRPGPCGVRAAHGQALRAKVCAGLDRHDRQRLGRSVGVSVAAVAVVAIAVGYGVAGDRGALSQVGQGQLTAALPLQVARQVAAAAVEPVARPAVRRAEAGGTARPLQPVAAVVPAPIPQALPGTGPALAGTASLAGSAALAAMPVRFVATQAGAVQRVSAHLDLGAPRAVREGEVLSGQLQPGALTERSAFGAVRSEDSLRQMVQVHVANLMPEVTGTPARIQRYLAARLPQVGALPLAQGGVGHYGRDRRVFAMGVGQTRQQQQGEDNGAQFH